jgi:hypothetical protein
MTNQPVHRTWVAGRIISAAGSDPAAVVMNAEAPRERVEPGSGERAMRSLPVAPRNRNEERIGAGHAVGGGVPEGAGRGGGQSSPDGGRRWRRQRRRHGRVELRPHRLDDFPLARSARACLGSIGFGSRPRRLTRGRCQRSDEGHEADREALLSLTNGRNGDGQG